MSIIYKTTNTLNGKIYIGKALSDDPRYLGSGKILRQAIEKYGAEVFSKDILEECSNDIVDMREVYWINHYQSFVRGIGYNIALGGTGGDTTSHHPDKQHIIDKRKQGQLSWYESLTEDERKNHREKISEGKQGRGNGRLGTHHTSETIQKIKDNQPAKSEDWKKAHAESMSARKGKPLVKKRKRLVVDGIEYESVQSAVTGLGLKHRKYFYDMAKQGKLKVDYL